MSFRIILFFTCLLFIKVYGQEVSGNLQKAQCIVFRNQIYVSGYEEGDKAVIFRIDCYNESGEKINSVTKSLAKGAAIDYYPPSMDTTHGLLTCIVQRTNNEKTGTLLRFTERLKLLRFAENTELARLNSFAAFTEEKLYYKKNLYMVREAKDSAGRFYFFRYVLDDSAVSFVYEFKWQFSFDQHTYHRIHPLAATDDRVYLYVYCLDSEKKGQWILELDVEKGVLIKTVKLNKNDNEVCFASQLVVYGSQEDVALAGVKYPSAGVDIKNGRLTFNYQKSKTLNTFFCQIDSAGDMKTNAASFFNVPNEILKEKEHTDLLLRCNKLEKNEPGFSVVYECLFRGKDNVYRTFGFAAGDLVQTPEGVYKPVNSGFVCTLRNEKKNPQSKQTFNQYGNDVPSSADRLFYKEPFGKVLTSAATEFSAHKKSAWLFSAFENKKTNTVEAFQYSMKSYVWETTLLKTLNDFGRFRSGLVGNKRFFLFHSSKDEKAFNLVLYPF